MSIKEAIGRPSQTRPTELVDIVHRQREYEHAQLVEGIAILEAAGIPSMFEELFDVLKLTHSDVKVPAEPEELSHRETNSPKRENSNDDLYIRFADGSVHLRLGWNYRGEPENNRLVWNEVSVTVEPLTQTLFVSGKECEKITKILWNTKEGKALLEDALIAAVRNPGKGSPARRI